MRKGLSQEGLKLIACVSMLIDHVGAILLPEILWLRIVGRLSFPIYCFLLVEGIRHSRNLKKYQLRLILAAVLSELPYDLARSGGWTWNRTSVMVTLWLGFWAVEAYEKLEGSRKWVSVFGIALVAELLGCDYGSVGIATILLFWWGKTNPRLLVVCMLAMNWTGIGVTLLGLSIPIQLFSLIALVPIGMYSGKKLTHSKWVQWGFYLFYPAHLLVLYLI